MVAEAEKIVSDDEYFTSDYESADEFDSDDGEPMDTRIQEEESLSSVEMKWKAKKVLLKFRIKVEDAILGDCLLGTSSNVSSTNKSKIVKNEVRDVSLWGVPLLPSKGHVGTDMVLLKFLKAKDFRVPDAFEMLQKTLRWRKEHKIDEILDENLSSGFEDLDSFDTTDVDGRPVSFFVYGGLREKELNKKLIGKEENVEEKFLRWRVQIMERAIRKLTFKPGGLEHVIEIMDLKNIHGPAAKEIRTLSRKTIMLFQDYYPEIIDNHIVLNAPFWYFTSHKLLSKFMSQRTKSKFVLARSHITRTLFKYIAPHNLPARYGGVRRDNDEDFCPDDQVSQLVVKGNAIATIRIPAEVGKTVIWDLTFDGWELSYKEEFIPNDEGSYNILLKMHKRMEGSVRNSFYISEPGFIKITIDNGTYKRIKVFYRYKTKPTVPVYRYLR